LMDLLLEASVFCVRKPNVDTSAKQLKVSTYIVFIELNCLSRIAPLLDPH